MRNRILLFGDTGQVGHEIVKQFDDFELGGSRLHISKANFENSSQVYGSIMKNKPAIVINAVAYTDVEKAEDEQQKAHQINSKTPGSMAQACKEIGAVLIHYSTDYVFSDSKHSPYEPSDFIEQLPNNVYGKTKLIGEKEIESFKGNHIILRTSWVFSSRRKNFVKTMYNLAKNRKSCTVINDQIGRPTSAASIAYQTLEMIEKNSLKKLKEKTGIYHLNNSGPYCSWFDFAREIFANLRVSTNLVSPISTDEYPSRADRPKNCRLDCFLFKKTFGTQEPEFWGNDLRKVLKELGLQKQS